MSSSRSNMASRLFELANARNTAGLIDIDAALALSRSAVRTLVALSPQAADAARYFCEEEIHRLDMDCTEEGKASIALIQDAVRPA